MVGKQISHYQIIRMIGSGGMGDVYLAEDIHLKRHVALKILSSSYVEDPEYRRRFAREAKAASLLDHPHIAHVYEIGESDGATFIVMQFIEGQTMQNKINGRPLEESMILELGLQIAEALEEAHRKGIVHRDLKPSNILITGRGEVKILDFGLAKTSSGVTLGSNSLTNVTGTQDGKILGTVPYMSPEQALGEKVDHRSDLFAAGLLLYEMATGHTAFSAENAAGTLYKIVHEQPESITKFNTQLSLELERIIRKSLQKEIDRRYQSARDLLVDLRNLVRDKTTGSAEPPPAKSFRLTWRPVVFVLAVILLLSSAWLLFFQSEPGIRSIAVLPFSGSKEISDGITDGLIDELSRIDGLKVMASTMVSSYKGRVVDPRQAGRDLDVDTILTGNVQYRKNLWLITVEMVDVKDGVVLWAESYQRGNNDPQQLRREMIAVIQKDLSVQLVPDKD